VCGERFSSSYTPAQKAAAAAPHPLARRDRWSVAFDREASRDRVAAVPSRHTTHERAWFDDLVESAGYATEAAAKSALREHAGSGPSVKLKAWFVIPPQTASGDHRTAPALASGALDQNDLVALADAILNNREEEFERLRVKFAEATLVAAAPPAPVLTRAEAAQQLVSLLVPGGLYGDGLEGFESGSGPGNAVSRLDFSDEDDQQEGEPVDGTGEQVYYSFDPEHSRKIHAAVTAYVDAPADAPAPALAEAARDLVDFLTDRTGEHGNDGDYFGLLLSQDDNDHVSFSGGNAEGVTSRIRAVLDALG